MLKVLNLLFAMMLLFAMFTLVGCEQKKPESAVYKEKITEDNIMEIADKIAEDKSIDKNEIEYFLNGMERLVNLDSLIGKTVKEVIEEQKELVREVSIKSLKISAARQEMNMDMGIEFKQKLKAENDTINVDGVFFIIKNKSDKTINTVKGKIRFVNPQNQIVKIVDLGYENLNIEPGKEIEKKDYWNHDPENKFDQAFRNTERLQASWLPERIEFADGKVVSIIEEDNTTPAEKEEAKSGESK